ncbi:hypothetical protein LMG27177_03727 [Paraburkholderia fynbosensis]|uniref:Uncharacterized protein n=1 Tax=Paraburkholderia fynbosensis TaxID=1200993 RepID=A0A6J5G6J8_9BURK|nr:hypothetical protein LMG27177_03727 [Paraburkholderia fynbosensis]
MEPIDDHYRAPSAPSSGASFNFAKWARFIPFLSGSPVTDRRVDSSAYRQSPAVEEI